jgi:hypothetical protein
MPDGTNSFFIQLPEGTGRLTITQENGHAWCEYSGVLPHDLALFLMNRAMRHQVTAHAG